MLHSIIPSQVKNILTKSSDGRFDGEEKNYFTTFDFGLRFNFVLITSLSVFEVRVLSIKKSNRNQNCPRVPIETVFLQFTFTLDIVDT
jgi:hypothetical protein